MLTKAQLLEPLARLRTDEVVVTTMSVVRPWGRYSDGRLDFASADSAMGHAADLALGLAMAQPARRVVCVNGDGSMLMSLGTLVTIVEAGVENLLLIVVDNGSYEITGNQPVPGSGRVDYGGLGRAAGFPRVCVFEDPDAYATALDELWSLPGPTLIVVRAEPGCEGPISRSSSEAAAYLQESLYDSARRLRAELAEDA